jgi:hypothetical protein
MGVSYVAIGKAKEAMDCFEIALSIKPDLAPAHFNRAMTWLLSGDFERGLAEYEWRWKALNIPQKLTDKEKWNGLPLNGRRLLLHAEQGFGDTIQFVRYASMAKERGGKVIIKCQPPLARLLSTCPGIDHVVTDWPQYDEFDCHSTLLSLPLILKTNLNNIPANVPYLFAEDELMKFWCEEFSKIDGFKIGIAWQGNPENKIDRYRSFPLKQFKPIGNINGVQLISLQKINGLNQLREIEGEFEVKEIKEMQEPEWDFADTAALMMNLDLVITPDTAIAHLAGSLGVPTWVGLSLAPDWRWMLEREDSPWYPTMRLFRQKELGKWSELFERIATACMATLKDKATISPD